MKALTEMLSGFEVGKHHIIIPNIIDAHFHVIDISIDDQSENFMTVVEYYDSLDNTNQTDLKNKVKNKNVISVMGSIVNVFNKLVLQPKEHFC